MRFPRGIHGLSSLHIEPCGRIYHIGEDKVLCDYILSDILSIHKEEKTRRGLRTLKILSYHDLSTDCKGLWQSMG